MKTAAFLFMTVALAIACRQGEPTGDPKTPANSPLPTIERKDPDSKPSIGDAG